MSGEENSDTSEKNYDARRLEILNDDQTNESSVVK